MFAIEVAAIAAELRAAEPQRLGRPISLPFWRRRSGYAKLRTAGAAAAVALMALGVAARSPLTPTERQTLDLPRVTNFSNTAPEREVALIIRRTQNEVAGQARFRATREGMVTRPI